MAIRTDTPDRDHPRAVLDADGVRDAYRRWAGIYDLVFGDWPDGWTLVGAAVIAVGGVLVAMPDRRPG